MDTTVAVQTNALAAVEKDMRPSRQELSIIGRELNVTAEIPETLQRAARNTTRFDKVEGLIITRIFADDTADESLKALDFRRLKFWDSGLERQFREYYFRAAVNPNQTFIFVSFVMGWLFQVWFFLDSPVYDREFWLKSIFQMGGLLVTFVAMVFHRLPGYRPHWEPYRIWPLWISAHIVNGLFVFAADLDRIGNLTGVLPDQRVQAIPDGISYLCSIGPFAWITSTFDQVAASGIAYMLVYIGTVVLAEYDRLGQFIPMTISVCGATITGCIIAYRKEAYHRRVFWLQKRLGIQEIPFDSLHFSSPTWLGNLSRWSRWKAYVSTNILLLDPDTERAANFGTFMTLQSSGQTRTSLSISAVTTILTAVQAAIARPLSLLDTGLRGVLVPLLLLAFALGKPALSRLEKGTLIVNALALGIFTIVMAVGFYLGIARRSQPERFSHESHYMFLISQTTFALATAAGFRYFLSLLVCVLYTVVAVVLHLHYEFSDSGYILGNPMILFAVCLFLHKYEKLLFVYYYLSRKYADSKISKHSKIMI